MTTMVLPKFFFVNIFDILNNKKNFHFVLFKKKFVVWILYLQLHIEHPAENKAGSATCKVSSERKIEVEVLPNL